MKWMSLHRSLFVIKLLICFITLIYCCRMLAAVPVDAAEYYYNRQDFKQALELYSSANEPKNTIKIAELKFLLNGRSAAREVLVSALEKNRELSPEYRTQLSDKLSVLLESFVSDEGQSEFFRAQTKIRHGDWTSAKILLEAAAGREDGNALVLELKAQCEKELKKTREYTNTLTQLRDLNPFATSVTEKLAEAYFADGDYSKIQSLFSSQRPQKNSYSNLLLLMSKSETGKFLDLDELEDFAPSYPIALFYVGKELIKNEEDRQEALKLLEQFNLKYTNHLLDGWDPLKISEKVIESKKLISSYSKGLK